MKLTKNLHDQKYIHDLDTYRIHHDKIEDIWDEVYKLSYSSQLRFRHALNDIGVNEFYYHY